MAHENVTKFVKVCLQHCDIHIYQWDARDTAA